MQEVEVTAEKMSTGATVTASFSFGDSVSELITQFGEDVVYSHVRRSLIIALQAYMRGQLEAEKQPEEIIASVPGWKPGLKKTAKSPLERAREEINKMSPADRTALAKEIRARAN